MTPNRTALLAEAESLLRSTPFTKEAASKVDSLLQLADRTVDHTEMRRAVLSQRDRELGRTPTMPEPTPVDQRFNDYLHADRCGRGTATGKAAGLNVGTDSAGGFTAPDGFAQACGIRDGRLRSIV